MERERSEERESVPEKKKKAGEEVSNSKEHQDKGRGNNDKEPSKNDDVKGLPHEQVPQPSDFNTQALEQL